MTDFSRVIETHLKERMLEDLPLFHCTLWRNLPSIITDGISSSVECDVFSKIEENAYYNYYFIGRPLYKYNSEELLDKHDIGKFPILLTFEESVFDDSSNIYPFDSGAFQGRLFTKAFKGELSSELLEKLDPLKTDIAQYNLRTFVNTRMLMKNYYENFSDYYNSKLSSVKIKLSQYSPYAEVYEELLHTLKNGSIDGRRSAIELQTKQVLKMKDVKSIYIPYSLLDDSLVKKIKAENPNLKINEYTENVQTTYGEIFGMIYTGYYYCQIRAINDDIKNKSGQTKLHTTVSSSLGEISQLDSLESVLKSEGDNVLFNEKVRNKVYKVQINQKIESFKFNRNQVLVGPSKMLAVAVLRSILTIAKLRRNAALEFAIPILGADSSEVQEAKKMIENDSENTLLGAQSESINYFDNLLEEFLGKKKKSQTGDSLNFNTYYLRTMKYIYREVTKDNNFKELVLILNRGTVVAFDQELFNLRNIARKPEEYLKKKIKVMSQS